MSSVGFSKSFAVINESAPVALSIWNKSASLPPTIENDIVGLSVEKTVEESTSKLHVPLATSETSIGLTGGVTVTVAPAEDVPITPLASVNARSKINFFFVRNKKVVLSWMIFTVVLLQLKSRSGRPRTQNEQPNRAWGKYEVGIQTCQTT